MSTFLRAIEFLSLSLWLGSDVFLSFVVAPGAFRVLSSRDQAGAMVGYALGAMHMGGIICGLLLLFARLALTAISQFTVSAKMAALRVEMGSLQATAADSPMLLEFGRLHRISVSLESGVLLAGIAAMCLLVRELAFRSS